MEGAALNAGNDKPSDRVWYPRPEYSTTPLQEPPSLALWSLIQTPHSHCIVSKKKQTKTKSCTSYSWHQ